MLRITNRRIQAMRLYSSRRLPVNTIVKFVPQQEAWVVERFGKFDRILSPGLNILLPIIESVSYVQTLKECTLEIPSQSAITKDNVTLSIDGVLYYKVNDPYMACYGIEDAEFAVSQLAQTTMRASIGNLTLDKTLSERRELNSAIMSQMNLASASWGITCLRYEIRDIHPPDNVVTAMHQQVSAERNKRAEILESEGQRQSAINLAEGKKQSQILESEGIAAREKNVAVGEAAAISLKATAYAEMINSVSKAIAANGPNGKEAITLAVANRYIDAFGQIAKASTTVVVPQNLADASGMVTQLMTVFDKVKAKN